MDVDVELPILGTEPLVVEFANTLYGTQDFLGTAALVARWCGEVGTRTFRDPASARALRTSIRALFTATVTHAAPPEAAIARVNAAAAAAPTSARLIVDPTGTFAAVNRTTATGDAAILGELATGCIQLLTDGRALLLRHCQAPDCCLFFVQHHPRRRYCHESCAHRDRQARYYRRRTTPQ